MIETGHITTWGILGWQAEAMVTGIEAPAPSLAKNR